MNDVIDGISRITDPERRGNVIGSQMADFVVARLHQLPDAEHTRVVERCSAMDRALFTAISDRILESLREPGESTVRLMIRSGQEYADRLVTYFLDDEHFPDGG